MHISCGGLGLPPLLAAEEDGHEPARVISYVKRSHVIDCQEKIVLVTNAPRSDKRSAGKMNVLTDGLAYTAQSPEVASRLLNYNVSEKIHDVPKSGYRGWSLRLRPTPS